MFSSASSGTRKAKQSFLSQHNTKSPRPRALAHYEHLRYLERYALSPEQLERVGRATVPPGPAPTTSTSTSISSRFNSILPAAAAAAPRCRRRLLARAALLCRRVQPPAAMLVPAPASVPVTIGPG